MILSGKTKCILLSVRKGLLPVSVVSSPNSLPGGMQLSATDWTGACQTKYQLTAHLLRRANTHNESWQSPPFVDNVRSKVVPLKKDPNQTSEQNDITIACREFPVPTGFFVAKGNYIWDASCQQARSMKAHHFTFVSLFGTNQCTDKIVVKDFHVCLTERVTWQVDGINHSRDRSLLK